MRENRRGSLWMRPLAVLLGAGLILLAVLAYFGNAGSARAQGGESETGDFCVDHYRPGAVCTANDVRIESIEYLTITNQCDEEPLYEMEAVLEILVSAVPSPDRYDIGLFVALADNQLDSALNGDYCYHDYLRPPLTANPLYGDYNEDTYPDIYNGPWWDGTTPVGGDGDLCGDMEEGTQVFVLTEPIELQCEDLDGDGAADVHICWSWDNNPGTACNSVQDAYPGTKSKCDCQIFNFSFTPSAVVVSEVEATPDRGGMALPLAAFVLLGLGTVAAVWRRREKGG